METVQNAQPQAAVESLPQATTQTVEKTKPMESIKKRFFPMADLELAQPIVDAAIANVNANKGTLTFNFKPDDDFPAGYGIAIVPICKKADDGKMETLGIAIGAIPDYATFLADPAGAAYAREVTETALMGKLANAIRPRADGGIASSVPFSIEDFTTSNRPEGVLVAFRKLAGAYVALLKKQGIKHMTDGILRSVLESAAFAEQQFPKVPQASWESLLDSMIKKATTDDMQAGMLVDWRKDRNNAGLPSEEDVDLSGLDFAAM